MRRARRLPTAQDSGRLRRFADPRLLLGVLLVLGSVVVGARVVAAQDDTVRYWSLASDVSAGGTVERDDLTSTAVRVDGAVAERYLAVDDELPGSLEDLVWTRDVPAGSLLSRDAMATAQASGGQLPLNVAAGSFPDDLAKGDHVDVWVGPAPGEDVAADSEAVLRDVVVLSAGGESAPVGGSLSRTVLVGVEPDDVGPTTLSAVSAGHVTLLRVASWTS